MTTASLGVAKRWLRSLIPRWRSPSIEARLEAALEGFGRDVHAFGARLKKFEDTARQLREEQKALRILVQGTAPATRAPLVLGSETVPTSLENVAGPAGQPERDRPVGSALRTVAMTALDACPACGAAARTLVCEYNRLILIDVEVDEALKRYDYCVCHGCGVTYAARRPAGDTFRELFERFDDNLGRTARNQNRSLLLSPGPLSEADRATLVARLAGGTFVSEHLERGRGDYLPQLQNDRLASSAHVEILGSHLTLRQPRVLEIRPRFGSILVALQRLYGAEPYALPMTHAQQFVMQQAYGITASSLLDFEHFTIPYEGQFDLIIANHMLTHALDPRGFLAEARRRLAPGGHLYLYNEPDDAEFLAGAASMINTLNPFHMQTFDRRSLTRVLAAGGFEPVFTGRHHGHVIFLGRALDGPRQPSMSLDERSARVAAYLKARDLAILRVPDAQRWRYRDEWEAIVARAVAAGVAGFDEQARLHPARPQAEPDTDVDGEP
ncbi:MAG: methyltransferase domain-containing protein [Acidobacteria bacterium]|nr:methyltransferase domain-containing protein [Acidobacteriota bacterium]